MRLNTAGIRVTLALLAAISLSRAQVDIRQMLHEVAPASKQDWHAELLPDQSEPPKKSVALAVAYSLLLPGLGDIYANNGGRAKYYLGAEAALWLTYTGIRSYGHWLKDDARTFAVERATADFNGKSEQFEVNLGNFNSVRDYNEAKLRNRQFDLVYDPFSTFAWQWFSDADRLHFKDLRIKGDEALRNSQFVIAGLVLNRLIAAISAARSAAAYNKEAQTLSSWRIEASVPFATKYVDGIGFTLRKEF